ncbi:MAG TPA: hypothetical protein VMH82_18680 [Myxococcota bacterium]|nr:hypothetical protein [Myxococcota bacterium]
MRRCALVLGQIALLGALALLASTHATASAPAGERGALPIPQRPRDAITGSQFARETDGWPESERQRAAVAEIERGNMPQFLRQLLPIDLHDQTPGGEARSATIWVLPDYLAIGPDEDFLYMPLTWPSATDVASRFGCVVPTPKIVDAVYRQARVHLEPQPLPAGPRMRTNAYYERHQEMIDAQRLGTPFGALISGHMKDVVLTDRLFDHPDRVAIYGWHRLDGQPIQPLSTVHGVRYADYSHGVRLVWHEVRIDGVSRSIYDVLSDPALAPLLSYEGAIRDPRGLMDPRRVALAAAAATGSEVAHTAH